MHTAAAKGVVKQVVSCTHSSTACVQRVQDSNYGHENQLCMIGVRK